MTTALRQNQSRTFSKHCKMATDEHQLFEMALAARRVQLVFSSKRGTEDGAQSFPLQEGRFCCFTDRIRHKSNLSVSCAGSLAYGGSGYVTPCILLIGRSVIQLRAVIFSNACLVPPLELGHFHYSLPDPTAF